jgi:hypothetical protein
VHYILRSVEDEVNTEGERHKSDNKDKDAEKIEAEMLFCGYWAILHHLSVFREDRRLY